MHNVANCEIKLAYLRIGRIKMSLRLGILASHPIQYQAPLFRELARRVDLKVYFAHKLTAAGQAKAGFGVPFEWDIDLLGGYDYQFLENRSTHPGVDRFSGCDTPVVGDLIRQERFDVVLLMGWYLKSFCQGLWACRRAGIPVMVRGDSRLGTRRGKVKTLLKELGYPIFLRQFDAHLYVGEDNRDYLEHYGVPDSRLFSSPHCVDTEWFRSRATAVEPAEAKYRLAIRSEERVVLFVGKLLDRKRPADIVDAAALLRRRGLRTHILVAGDGPLREELAERARSCDVKMTFLGFQNQSQLPLVYRAADILILPSDGSETWGLVVNEAQACGLPVVVSDAVGCARDLVESGRTGVAYPVGNVVALAEAMEAVLLGRVDASAITSRVNSYSMEAAADGVLKAAQQLVLLSQGAKRVGP